MILQKSETLSCALCFYDFLLGCSSSSEFKVFSIINRLTCVYLSALCFRTPSTLLWMFALEMELGSPRIGNKSRIRSLFERALETKVTQQSVILWRAYLAYEFHINKNVEGARRVYFRAIHACPWYELLQFLCTLLSLSSC